MRERYTPITGFLEPSEAERAFHDALLRFDIAHRDLDLERDVVVDTSRSADGRTRRRYRLRKELIPQFLKGD
jgi:hypothetical protein